MAKNAPELSLKWLFFGFSGRISRKTYALSAFFQLLLLTLLFYQAIQAEEDEGRLVFVGLFGIVLFLFLLWSVAALSIKRLHDLNLPAVFAGLLFVPALNWIAFFYLMLKQSHPEANEHGAPPFGRSE
ncbi:MAG: DUF805 domain-containing protein [Salaquimonas sp.]